MALTSVLESLPFEVRALDVPTFVATSGVMLAAALFAGYIPTYRAPTLDPIRAFRMD